jgi:hypothetical protein
MIGKDKILRFDVSVDETNFVDLPGQFEHLFGVINRLGRLNFSIILFENVMQTLSQQIHNKKC